jgi:hypothetical protein
MFSKLYARKNHAKSNSYGRFDGNVRDIKLLNQLGGKTAILNHMKNYVIVGQIT